MSAPEATQAVPTLATAHDALTAAHAYAELIADTAGDRDRIGGVPWAELAALDRSGLLGSPSQRSTAAGSCRRRCSPR